jgi:carbamoylphosphate synthase large subunit
LNAGLELERTGVFAKHGVRVLGTTTDVINTTEDRQLFNDAMAQCDIPTMPSIAVTSVKDAVAAADEIGYPVIMRSAFALGGLGSGFAHNDARNSKSWLRSPGRHLLRFLWKNLFEAGRRSSMKWFAMVTTTA